MKKYVLGMIVGLLVSPAFAVTPVVIDCFRGPWQKDVIWDHPNAQFVDTLMANGYSIGTATDIANHICRDETLARIDDPDERAEEMKAKLIELINVVPRDAK